MGRASSFPVPPEYLLCLLWAKTSRVILMSCSKHFCIVNHRFLSPSPNQYKDIYAEHIKALDTIEKTIIPCKTFAFGRWHHGIIHYTLHMPAIYRKAEWPCLPAVHIRAAREAKQLIAISAWGLQIVEAGRSHASRSSSHVCLAPVFLPDVACCHRQDAGQTHLSSNHDRYAALYSPGADQKTSFPLVACQHSEDSASLALLPLTTPTQEVCKDNLNHRAEMLKHLQAPAVLT